SINWILVILLGFLLTEFTDLVRLNAQPYISLTTNLVGQLVLSLVSFVLVLILSLKLLNQSEFFLGLSEFEESELNSSIDSDIGEQSNDVDAGSTDSGSDSLSSASNDLESEQLIFDEVKNALKKQKLYTIPRLSLTDVSKETSFLERDISRAINLVGETNFCEFVNQLRIDSVIEQLPLKNRTILDMALESGFNSKSSFNAAFKRTTKMTPSQFIRNRAQD
ncbi:MAG: helix-turn-helix domain-containing protein, partial [Kangiellaceae bacterium]|nr:helix-turn-helix domain-containing protein [Kangiellaceae bacterium]